MTLTEPEKNNKPSLFQKISEGSKDHLKNQGLHPFFNLPLQQLVRRNAGPDWELTVIEKQLRYSALLSEYLHRRFGKDVPAKHNTVLLSDNLIYWLNEPAKGDFPLLITNFMWLIQNYVNPFDRLYDIKTVKGTHDFYQDMAGKYYIGMSLPSCLIPDAVFDYLAQPFPCQTEPASPALPLSRGLAHLWREYIPEIPFAPENALPRAHFLMRMLVFAHVTEVDLRMFSSELIVYLNAPLFPSDREGIAATGLIFEVFRLAGLGDDPNWKTPSFVMDKVQRFFTGVLKSLMLPPIVAEHHLALAEKCGVVVDAVKVLTKDTKAAKKYVLRDEVALPINTQLASVNIIETGGANTAFNPITSALANALDAAKVSRTYILPEYEPYPEIIKAHKLANQPLGKINLFALELDKCADMMLSQGLRYFNDRINIGYCTWETSQLPLPNQMGLDLLDEIWVPTEYVKNVFAAHTSIPIHVMPYPVALAKPTAYMGRKTFDLPQDAFIFLNTLDCMDWMSRKNPMAIAKAFQKAFPNEPNIRLVIKTRNIDKPKISAEYLHLRYIQEMTRSDPRIMLIHKEYSEQDMAALMHMTDCYVSLHRNSGYGRAVMEAMLSGKPVVITDGTGPADYANETTSALVNATQCSTVYDAYYHLERERGHHWFDPDIAHAAIQMRRVFDDKAYAQSIAKAGQDTILKNYNAEATGAKMYARITQLLQSVRNVT